MNLEEREGGNGMRGILQHSSVLGNTGYNGVFNKKRKGVRSLELQILIPKNTD